MGQTYICPHADNCRIYKNWVEQTGDSSVDIIHSISGYYSCLALIAIIDPITEGGIKIGESLEKRLKCKPNDVECSYIKLLNVVEALAG